jgi:hypothetical protein|tara:strand:- start:30 stop:2087 length:2058 start_codon:yes stop_codon:yes gene_type:complete
MDFTKDELATAIVSALRTTGLNSSGSSTSSTGGSSGGATSSASGTKFAVAAGKASGEAVGNFLDNQFNKAGAGAAGAINKTIGKIPFVGTALAGFGDIVLETNETFKNLSKVGAGFNGNLGELRMGAADTHMQLGEFANMVGSNSELLSGFAGGVQGGIKQFRILSDEMLRGPISQFQNLGMSVEEANEFIISNMETQRRDARFRRADGSMNTDMMLATSLEMAKSLDVMAKLSGKQLKEMNDDVVARGRAGATQAALRQMENNGAVGAADTYKLVQKELQTGPKVLRDLFDDVTQLNTPLEGSTKAFSSMNGDALRLARQARAQLKAGDRAGAVASARAAVASSAAFAASDQGLTIARMGDINEYAAVQAQVLQETGGIIDQIQDRAKSIGATLNSTQDYVDTFNSIIQDIKADQTNQTASVLPGQDIAVILAEMDRAARKSASDLGRDVASNLSNNAKLIDAMEVSFTLFKDTIRDFSSKVKEMINLLPGAAAAAAETDGASTIERQIANNLTQNQQDFVKVVRDVTAPMIERDEALAMLGDAVTADGYNITSAPGDFGGTRALGGPVQAGKTYKINEGNLAELFAPGVDGAMIPNMKNVFNRVPDMVAAMQSDIESISDPAAALANRTLSSNENTTLEQKLDTLNHTMLQLVSINSVQARTGEKHLRSSRSVGNLMTGLGRA